MASGSPPIQGSIICVLNIDQYNNFGKYNRKHAYIISSKKYRVRQRIWRFLSAKKIKNIGYLDTITLKRKYIL